MRVVRAQEKQDNRHAQQELFRRRVLVAVVDLLPHVQVVVGAGVELKRHAAHVVEHDVGAGHVGDVGQRPGRLLRHAGDDVEQDAEGEDQHHMDGPCS